MRTRAGILTSEIHFIISKPVSLVPADATEVPTCRHKTSSTNGLAATGPQSGSNFKKKFWKTIFFRLHYDQKNTLNPFVKSVFKSVHKHDRYLHFCDRHVCSIQYAATRRIQLCAWPILCTGLCPAQLFLVNCMINTKSNQLTVLGGIMVRASDLRSSGRRFDSLSGHYHVT